MFQRTGFYRPGLERSSPVGVPTTATFSSDIISPTMYKVTIQSTPINESNWKVVAAGIWRPGEQPQLEEHILSAEVVGELFNVTPSATKSLAWKHSDLIGRLGVFCFAN